MTWADDTSASAPSFSEITWGGVAATNSRRKFLRVPEHQDATGGVDFHRFKVTSNITDNDGFYVESQSPIGITTGREHP